MKKIGIFGGSFDPVHNDHINICKKFTSELNLDLTLLIPAACSPFKDGSEATKEERFNMLSLAVNGNEKLIPDRTEIDSVGKSYTYLTVEKLKNKYSDAELFLLVGTDSLLTFPTWKNPDLILKHARVVVAERKGENTSAAVENFKKHFGYAPQVIKADGDISSSLIREYLMLGLDVSGFLPVGVYEYIKTHSLYNPDKYHLFVREHSKTPRLIHTVGVMVTAVKYAKATGADEKKAALAALLHDSAKYLNIADYPGCKLPEGVPEPIIHQYLGAYVAENVLGVTDSEILGAIKWHTTGKPDMTLLEKIIYTADLLEPNRSFPGVNELRLAVDKDFESGFKLCVFELNKFLKRGNEPVYYLSEQANEYYNGK